MQAEADNFRSACKGARNEQKRLLQTLCRHLADGPMAAGRGQRAVSEADYVVSLDGERIGVTDPEGEQTTLALAELNGVMIETNDGGPLAADVWWLLFGADDRIAVAFPQGASGEQAAIDWLTGLPGFDHDAMIMAMGSTANAVFPVWRRVPWTEI
jgi:hypothetical protein